MFFIGVRNTFKVDLLKRGSTLTATKIEGRFLCRCTEPFPVYRIGAVPQSRRGELSCWAYLLTRRSVQVLEMPRWLQVIISASHTVPLPSTGD